MATQLLIKNHNLFINLTQTDLLVGISAHKYLYFLFNLKKNFVVEMTGIPTHQVQHTANQIIQERE